MYLAIASAILIVMALAFLAVNTFGTKTVLLVTVLAFFTNNAAYLDIALVYALINFIGVIAVLRFLEYGREQEDTPVKSKKKKA